MNEKFMDIAFEEANLAYIENEVPIGAVIVKNDVIIARGHNTKEKDKCVLKHAELFVIENASKILDNWRLDGCDIYITLEPCPMCASAIKQARISNVYCALSNSDVDNINIVNLIFDKNDSINKKVNFYNNLRKNDSEKLLNNFFKKQRNK